MDNEHFTPEPASPAKLSILPFVITGAISIVITLFLSNWILKRQSGSKPVGETHMGLTDAARKGKDAVVFIFNLQADTSTYYSGRETGSGVIISPDGYIVTNYHVVGNSYRLHVELNDRRRYHAQLVAVDSSHDIALLHIRGSSFPYLDFGDSDLLEPGEPVLAVGNPYSLQSTVTGGIISALHRSLDIPGRKTNTYVQTDVPINLGNSGGALLNRKGELVGLNLAYLSMTGQYEGFSFAIPSNLVSKIAKDLREFGATQNISIGIYIRIVSPEIAAEAGLSETYGIVVDAIMPGSAADQAGIESLDIILTFNGKRVLSTAHFKYMLDLYRPGDVAEFGIVRNGKHDTIRMTFAARKNQ